jgi:hypothetical protein
VAVVDVSHAREARHRSRRGITAIVQVPQMNGHNPFTEALETGETQASDDSVFMITWASLLTNDEERPDIESDRWQHS